jgi:hypothetical protein
MKESAVGVPLQRVFRYAGTDVSTIDRSVYNVKHCVVLAPYCTASFKIILDFGALGLQV